jgi:phosphatidylinositol glycan class B
MNRRSRNLLVMQTQAQALELEKPESRDVQLPVWARVADVIAGLLLGLAAVVAGTNGFRIRIDDVQLSVTSWERALLWAAVVLAVRHALVRREPWPGRIAAALSGAFSGEDGAASTWGERLWAQRVGAAVLAMALVVGALIRLWVSMNDDGVYWPDEVYQSLEPAHWLVFGYGLLPWEFVEGARHWTFPGLVAGVMKLSEWSGFTEPREYLTVLRLVFSALGLATAYGVYVLARAFGASVLCSAAGATLFSLAAPATYFAPRAISETASALPVVLGFALAAPPGASRSARLLGVSLIGLATLIRFQNGLFALVLLGLFMAREPRRVWVESFGVLAAWALVMGVLDLLTWGSLFHAVGANLRFNLVEGQSARFGTAPAVYYLEVLGTAMPTVTAVLIVCGAWGTSRARAVFLAAATFLVVHSAIPHKEFRFILPALPLFCALAAVGLDVAARKVGSDFGCVLVGWVLLAGVASAAQGRGLTFRELGGIAQYPSLPVYDYSGPVNRLLLRAHRQADLCGLKIDTADLVWTGGYSYLHRPVPLYGRVGPAVASRFYNYKIVEIDANTPGKVVARDGDLELVRISASPCVRDQHFSWRLP